MRHILRSVLWLLPPEMAHDFVISTLANFSFFLNKRSTPHSLPIRIFGVDFPNPVGLAAGFDKNAVALSALARFSFGFIECGTVTLHSQLGNKKPRLFRLNKHRAIINRMGFNNKGIDFFESSLKKYDRSIPLGINIGVNHNSSDFIGDYCKIYHILRNECDYIVFNVSSPNTKGLRALQSFENLDAIFSTINRGESSVLIKISPDITDTQKSDIASVVKKYSIDGLIVSNTTIQRPDNISEITGGMSGAPLLEYSNCLLRDMKSLIKVPVIASGGIMDAHDAYKKIKLGASLVQLYSAIIFHGFEIVNIINRDLKKLLQRDGFNRLQDAVGCEL